MAPVTAKAIGLLDPGRRYWRLGQCSDTLVRVSIPTPAAVDQARPATGRGCRRAEPRHDPWRPGRGPGRECRVSPPRVPMSGSHAHAFFRKRFKPLHRARPRPRSLDHRLPTERQKDLRGRSARARRTSGGPSSKVPAGERPSPRPPRHMPTSSPPRPTSPWFCRGCRFWAVPDLADTPSSPHRMLHEHFSALSPRRLHPFAADGEHAILAVARQRPHAHYMSTSPTAMSPRVHRGAEAVRARARPANRLVRSPGTRTLPIDPLNRR